MEYARGLLLPREFYFNEMKFDMITKCDGDFDTSSIIKPAIQAEDQCNSTEVNWLVKATKEKRPIWQK